MVNTMVISPEEYKSKSDFSISYGRHETPFGECLIGITGPENAVCFLWFIDDNFEECMKMFRKEWPQAKLIEAQSETEEITKRIFSHDHENLSVLLRGTEFQTKVWQALMKIPKGEIHTYSQVAEDIGHPKGIRAAGTAMKSNRIGYLVPCHRVMSKAGVNKYRWGAQRREKILEFERQNK